MYRFGTDVDAVPVGAPLEAVEARLGTASQRWERGLQCVSCYPCTPAKQQGVVLFYQRGLGCGFDFGWYLYFDGDGRLVEVEGSST